MNPPCSEATESEVSRPSWFRRLARFRCYALASLSVAIALWISLLLEHFHFRVPAGPLFLTAVALSAWSGGTGPAVLAVLLSIGSFYWFFVEPVRTIYIHWREIPNFIAFAAFASLIFWFSMVRRRVEADLLRTRDELRIEVEERSSLLDLTHDAISVCDMNFITTYWNLGAEELYGWTREETIGKRWDLLLQTVFPKPIEAIRAELLQTDRWEGELARTKKDGVEFIVMSRWALRRDAQGRPVAILATSNDITARRRREKEIQDLNRELAERSAAAEASNKELEAFAYSVSHDLRAPLRHMAGFAQLLRSSASDSLNEKSKNYLAIILEAAKRMGMLIDDLLAFSRIGRAEAHNSAVSLDQLVRETLAEARQDAAGREIVWKVSPLPDVWGDRSMLRLVLTNLISNAVKFTRTRHPAEIEVGCAERKDDHMVLFVRDNGVGFDMKYHHKLFGVFQRLHAQETFEGTGIGLAIVQRVVHRHGGRVWAEGAINRGATFYFSLPMMKRSD